MWNVRLDWELYRVDMHSTAGMVDPDVYLAALDCPL